MKTLYKILKYFGILFLCMLIGAAIYIYKSGPELPHDVDDIIDTVLEDPIPELIHGVTGIADSDGVNIWYESISPQGESKGAILLIMGISNDALGWPPKFIDALLNAGYQVVRYDHRGTGMSDWMVDYDPENPYSLSDMAHDGLSVMDELHIEKANILGASMGGMIAQQMAIDYPNRTQSLISIMSSGDILDPELPPISADVAIELIMVAIKYGVIGTERNMIKLHIASRSMLMGAATHTLDVKEISENVLYNIRKRKGYNANVSKQHQEAVAASGPRYKALKNLRIPCLIIHGVSDPFIPIEHGRKCAGLISNADSMWVDNMGHDIPDIFVPRVADKIIRFYNSFDVK